MICHVQVRLNSRMQDECISYLCCIKNKTWKQNDNTQKNCSLKQQFIPSQNAMGRLGWSCLGHLHGCHQLGTQLRGYGLGPPHSHIWDLIWDVWNGWDSGPLSPWDLSPWAFPCLEEHSKEGRAKQQSFLKPRLRNYWVWYSNQTKHRSK